MGVCDPRTGVFINGIRARILQWVGIPCGIGIGATKTLAKLANYIAKTAERKPGIGDTLYGQRPDGSQFYCRMQGSQTVCHPR